MLGPFKQNCTDHGYNSNPSCQPDYRTLAQKKVMGAARARHKTVNGQLKSWKIMHNKFRHNRLKHHLVFQAVLVGGQIKLQNGRPAFQVDPIGGPACFWE